jgi:dihydrodiol dehydrogenase / D-xylose 1-dehydrogenase (NADP)
MKDFRNELDAGSIGDIKVVSINFGANISHINRLAKKEMGGGALLDIGCYAVMFTNFIFGPEKPHKIVASGQLLETG